MGFKGTKKQWNVVKDKTALINVGNIIYRPEIKLDDFDSWEDYHDVTEIESIYNALLISKAPCFYEDALKDLELFDELLKSLPLGLQHLTNTIKERKKEKEQLIKQATEL